MKSENKKRSELHQRNESVETILSELQQLLSPAEQQALKNLPSVELPHIYIVGCARSGTTLCYQYLAASKHFCYPSNFISRFYYAPYIGSRLQQLLYEFDTKQEISSSNVEQVFSSALGKTKGALSPHEFWYFWRRFFSFGDIQVLSDEALQKADSTTFLKELNAMKFVFNKPLLMKAMILNFHIPYLYSLYKNAIFIFIERNTAYNAQSLLQARKNFYGNEKEWYSFKTPAYFQLIHEEPEKQVVEQVFENNQLIKNGLAQIPEANYIHISHEAFCQNPAALLTEIGKRINQQLLPSNELATSFQISNKPSVSEEQWSKIQSYAKQQ